MKIRIVLLLVIIVVCLGCAANSIQPWDRDLLSEKQMQLPPDPIQNFIDDHIYFSKEASTGGQGVGGGGCGCN